MAESEVATETREKPRGGLFGRRKQEQGDQPETYRSETEWVDTLHSYSGAEEDVAAPFAGEPLTGLPEESEPYRTPADRAGWRRRSTESIEDIENYIDHVIGTPYDPLHQMKRPTRRDYGLDQTERLQRAHVDGIDHEIMIAFPFPADEFAGARVVYETEGGYVLEVQRKRGKNTETHHFTVSKVGEVAHVLDKLRRMDKKELERAIAEQAAQDRYARGASEALPEKYQASTPAGQVEEGVSEPERVDREAGETPRLPDEHTNASDEPPADNEISGWTDEGEAEPQKKGLLGRFGRKKGAEEPTGDEEPADAPAEKKGFKGRFGRKKGQAEEEAETS